MSYIETFEAFAADFEATLRDDGWSRAKRYIAEAKTLAARTRNASVIVD
jgi:hypothetical protein